MKYLRTTRTTIRNRVTILMICAVAFCVSSAHAEMKPAVQLELEALAKAIEPVLKKKKVAKVFVGKFNGPSKVQGGGGAGISLGLAEELTKLGFVIDQSGYEMEIRGEYSAQPDPSGLAIKIVAKLYDDFGRPLGQTGEITVKEKQLSIERELYGSEAVPGLLGIDSISKPTADYAKRSKEWTEQYRHPRAPHIADTVVRTSEESPYGIALAVKRGSEYKFVSPDKAKSTSRAFVPLKKDDVFGVLLVNDSDHEAAVTLLLDGVNCFSLSKSKPKPLFWIVPKKGRVFVRGWDLDLKTSSEFKVVEDFEKTVAAKIGIKSDEDVGLIFAAFSAAWENEKQKPSDEGAARGVGEGNKIKDAKIMTTRHIGQVRETITIRYER